MERILAIFSGAFFVALALCLLGWFLVGIIGVYLIYSYLMRKSKVRMIKRNSMSLYQILRDKEGYSDIKAWNEAAANYWLDMALSTKSYTKCKIYFEEAERHERISMSASSS